MLATRMPREQNGRDSFGRYRAQIRAAALACLIILEGKEIDRVYSDFHDDYVVRYNDQSGTIKYSFVQVKTKGKANHCWTVSEIFGIKVRAKDPLKQDTDKIKDSFIGKLLLHTVIFKNCCNDITFETNIHLHDDIIAVDQDIKSGEMEHKYTKILLATFNECFKGDLPCELSKEEIKNNVSKLNFSSDVQCLKDNGHNFEGQVRETIFKYSEIDLHRTEVKEIALKLLDLVENKTSGVILEINEESVEKLAGISIDDLLSILSISKDAYKILLHGGDTKAIKSASILQRIFKNSGAGKEVIEYCSRCKTEWDVWLRKNRHILSEFDLISILQQVKKTLSASIRDDNCIDFSDLKDPIVRLLEELDEKKLLYDLTNDLVVGGVLSELVKGKS